MQNDKHMSKQKKTTIIILVAVVAISLIAGAIALMNSLEKRQDIAPEGAGTAASRGAVREDDLSIAAELELDIQEGDEYPLYEETEPENTIFFNGKTYRYNDDLSVLLIVGVDDYDTISSKFRNTSQSDFLLVTVFDTSNQTVKLLQINRDSMTDVPVLGVRGDYIGLHFEQIALAHTYGSGLSDSNENAVHAVSRFLYDIPIDNYFTFTMSAIPIINDKVGGVTVTIEDDFTGVDETLVKGETITLMGDQAEHFVRSRFTMQDDATNLARMRRQREYMRSMIEALTAAIHNDSSFVMDVYGDVSEYLYTDCSVDQLNQYSEQFSDYTLSEIVTPEGEAKKGEVFVEFYVDEASLQQLVIDTFYVPVD